MGWFDGWLGEEKIFKFVYELKNPGYYDKAKTLLVTARKTSDAVKKFYRVAGADRVGNILEFTEIKYGSGDVEHEG